MNDNHTTIVAEMSANHMQDISIAKRIIEKAKEIGCDAIKLQTGSADRITIDCDKECFWINSGTQWDGQTLYKLYKTTFFPLEWHKELFDYAKSIGICIFSTPIDETGVDLLEEVNNPVYKIGSFEITDIPLIKYAASKMKPMVIATGIATEEEIEDALSACREVGNNDITILKCTSEYPAKIENLNLSTIFDIKNKYNVKVGFSDHTTGSFAAIIAASMGATMIEKHFTLDRKMGGPDASFSIEPEEFRELISKIRDVERAKGKVSYELDERIKRQRKFARSLFVVSDVKKGDVISKNNVRSIRPSIGMKPKFYEDVLGRKFNQKVERGTPLSEDLFN